MTEKNDIRESKYQFLHNENDQIPSIFHGIRKYIKKCYETEYEAKPEYSYLKGLIENAFRSKEDEAMKILKEISQDILINLIHKIINDININIY